MGLVVSHGCWEGGYISFMVWREKIAEIVGIPPLMLMEGFYREGMKDEFGESVRGLPIKWECLKPDSLYILLAHSDCDGSISSEEAILIAKRLEEILLLIPNEKGPGHIRNWREIAKRFIEGLRLAGGLGETVVFG